MSINKNQLVKNNAETSIKEVVEGMQCTISGYVVPSELIHVIEQQNCITGTTYELLVLNRRNESAEEDSLSTSNRFIDTKVEEIRSYISKIYKMSEVIAFTEMLLSFATVAREYPAYNKPAMAEVKAIVLHNARHALLEKMIQNRMVQEASKILHPEQKTSFVANDIELTDAKPMMLLRGVNMSGKSTLLQTLVYIVILAQCGAFVPCSDASLFPFSSIYASLGNEESLDGHASAFAGEMREMNQIVTQANEGSLVVIDEPCVSTSVRDGIGIAFACLEKLIVRKAFVICATHYSELEVLGSIYGSVIVKEMKSKEKDNGSAFEYLYKLGDGSSLPSGYGIKIASDFLPPELIDHAWAVHHVLSQAKKIPKSKTVTGLQAMSAILQRLLVLRMSSMDDDGLTRMIKAIRDRCSFRKA